jgi:hypothetical protein
LQDVHDGAEDGQASGGGFIPSNPWIIRC